MIETTYKYKETTFEIFFNENLEEWYCKEPDVYDSSLAEVKKKIAWHIDTRERMQKRDIKPSEGVVFKYQGYERVKITSIAYSGLEHDVWVNNGKERYKIKLTGVYMWNEEIEKLLIAQDAIKKRILDWQKRNKYEAKKLARDMGYSEEYAKEILKINL